MTVTESQGKLVKGRFTPNLTEQSVNREIYLKPELMAIKRI